MSESKSAPASAGSLAFEPTISATLSRPDTRALDDSLAPTMDASESGSSSQPSTVDVAAGAPMAELPFGDRYEMRRVLGAGGMGEVRLYKDARIGREIAVKVMHGGAAVSASSLERFVREARVQGQLEHPAVVPVYDLGVAPDGAAYFSMKRLRGRALDEIVRLLTSGDADAQSRYSRRKLLTAFANVCLAVHFAHARGVLHRDLKPANVMLGDFGEVHLLDWGVAKIVGVDEAAGDSGAAEKLDAVVDGTQPGAARTVSGAVIGTPGYMAPEQARGLLEQLDARSDVYALGAMLFELLALEPLHHGASPGERLVSTIEGCDPAPSHRAPAREIPPELDAICGHALALEPRDRYASARELGDAIERFLDGDRDLERRRSLANEHLDRARAALVRARESNGADAHTARGEAMRDVTRALAFDSDSRQAAALLAQLFVDAPDEMPPEAERELAASTLKGQQQAAALASARGLSLMLLLPMLLWLGVRNWSFLACAGAGLAISALFNIVWWRAGKGRPDHVFGLLAVLASAGALAMLSYLFGPFVLVPTMTLLNAMIFAVQTDFRMKAVLVLTAPLPILLPLALDLLGITHGGWEFLGDHLTIHARAIFFHPAPALTFLVISGILMTTAPIVVIGRLREALAKSERRNFLHAWHLRQLAK